MRALGVLLALQLVGHACGAASKFGFYDEKRHG
jgi:hypothetical protein